MLFSISVTAYLIGLIDDLRALFTLLQFFPFGERKEFDLYFGNTRTRRVLHLNRLKVSPLLDLTTIIWQRALQFSFLRRMKDMRLHGKSLLSLPEISFVKVPIDLSEADRMIYDLIRNTAKSAREKDSLDYSHVFFFLGNLLKLCNHSDLVDSRFNPCSGHAGHELKATQQECENAFCGKIETDYVFTKCSHFFCMDCVEDIVRVCILL